jgi:hypothetical protein
MGACVASVDGAERLDEEPFTNLQRLLLVEFHHLRVVGDVILVTKGVIADSP